MRRLAIFVEGYTELLLVENILKEIANRNDLAVHLRQIRGGGKGSKIPKSYVELKVPTIDDQVSHYVLVVDCGGDNAVSQKIREEHDSLTKNGYEKIIGLRDVYPDFTRNDINKLRQKLMLYIKTSLAPVTFLLGIMEVESWFLAEHNHFELVDSSITPERINLELGFNPISDDMQNRAEPAKDLHSAYQLAGKDYIKGDPACTVDKLNYDFIYLELKDKIPDLQNLINEIDTFLS